MAKVLFNKEEVVKIDDRMIQFLKEEAGKNQPRKIRLCLHKNTNDSLHEMIIVIYRDVYVRPHKHINKSESFHIIKGSFLLALFDDKGEVSDKILIDSQSSKGDFICRLEKNIWHTVIPLTDFVVFHETTNGPYTGRNDSVFAPWALQEGNSNKIGEFIKSVLKFNIYK